MEWVINVTRRNKVGKAVHFFDIHCQSLQECIEVVQYLADILRDDADIGINITRWDHIGYDVTDKVIKMA